MKLTLLFIRVAGSQISLIDILRTAARNLRDHFKCKVQICMLTSLDHMATFMLR